jgi:hypothetical protein
MSTAIAKHYVHEGFAIAADGRKRDSETHFIVSDDTQKIFDIPGMQIGYALMGTVELSPEDSKETTFDFCDQVVKSIEYLGPRKFKDLFEYASELAGPINNRLAEARRNATIGPYPAQPSKLPGPGHDIARVLFDGYYQDKPSRVHVRFFHDNQKLSTPQITREPLGPLVLGPGALLYLILDENDQRFTRYRRPWDDTLPGAVEACKNCILAFSSPEALEIDQEASLGVGPNVHIATITRTDGFQWVQGFKPKGIK